MIPGNVFSGEVLQINVCFFRILVSLERFLSVISTFWVTLLPKSLPPHSKLREDENDRDNLLAEEIRLRKRIHVGC